VSSPSKAPVRILLLAPPWFTVPPAAYGGTEQIVALLADGLSAGGHEVTLVASGGSTTRARLVAPNAVAPTEQLGSGPVELAHLLAGYRHRGAFDVIHDHTVVGLALASMPGGPPVVHTAHGAWTAATTPLYRTTGPQVRVITVSRDQAVRAPAGIDIAGTVHNALDVSAHPFTPVKGDHLVFVGRASPEKGPEVAIEVARRTGRRLRMAMKVNEPDEHAFFEAVVRPALRTADVEVVDVVDQVGKLELLRDAAALLFPIAWDEPFGLVPIEAGACGTPVVAFARGAVPEVVVHGRSGVLVRPGDVDGFCDGVGSALDLDPAGCRAVVAARFDAPRLIAEYLAIYQEVADPRSTPATPVVTLSDPPSGASARDPGGGGGHGLAGPRAPRR
jgi:glycosyltransferase involved in cell wall biosynthesis